MKYGLSEEVYKEIKRIVQKYSNYKFILYGSRARGDFRSTSDIDIAVRGNVSEQDKFAILNEFDLLNIPYMIDIVFYKELEKEELKQSIDNEGIEFEK